MEWDTPPRTRLFGAAALLILAAGLSCLDERLVPSLNDGVAGPAAAPPPGWGAGQKEDDAPSRDAAAREELFSAAQHGLRDAMGSPSLLRASPGQSDAAQASRPWRSASPEAQDPEERWVEEADAALLEETAVEVGQDIKNGTLGKIKTEALGTAKANGQRLNDINKKEKTAGRAEKRARPARVMIQDLSGAGPEGSAPAKAPGRALRRRLEQAARALKARGAARGARKARRAPRVRFRPVLLSALLGKGAIRPPTGRLSVPDLSGLAKLLPARGPGGQRLETVPAGSAEVETLRPPDKALQACPVKGGHWHASAQGPALYHDSQAWGRLEGKSWAWAARAKGYWWAWTAPKEPTWLEHRGRWWWRSDNVWFLLHQGEAWGYRLFIEGRDEGLIHPATGTRMIYSQDGLRVAVVTPGDGAVLFDALTGRELARWTEAQLGRRKQAGPFAPSSLSLPR